MDKAIFKMRWPKSSAGQILLVIALLYLIGSAINLFK
jgi:hypothetical protein